MADKCRIQPVLTRKGIHRADQPARRHVARAAAIRRRRVYVKIALLALAAAAFLAAAVIGVSPTPGPRLGMFIPLPWVDVR